jgi:hypothetical protein
MFADGESIEALIGDIAAIGRRFLPPVRTPRRRWMESKPWCERPRRRARGVAPAPD